MATARTRQPTGRRDLCYLDNAATTWPKPDRVRQVMHALVEAPLGNPGRGGHLPARTAEQHLEHCRHRLNQLFHGPGPERFIFTLNGTDALNQAVKGLLAPGDHVVTGVLEHHSLLRPLRQLERAGVIQLTIIGAAAEGYYRPVDFFDALRPNTRLVAMSHASNVVGTVQPIGDIGAACRRRGVCFLVDAAQTAGLIDIDLGSDPVDLLAAPGHKGLYGPTGTGILYVAPSVTLRSSREGGSGGDSDAYHHPAQMPSALEAGTPNVIGIAALAEGVAFVQEQTPQRLLRHELALLDQLHEGLQRLPTCRVIGGDDPMEHVGICSLTSAGLEPVEIAAGLDQMAGIAVRAGLHCAADAHRALGTFPGGTLRVSLGHANTPEDISYLLAALGALLQGI